MLFRSIDRLLGLKENVIIGKLIPAATGLKRYRTIEIGPSEKVPKEAYERETLLAALQEIGSDGGSIDLASLGLDFGGQPDLNDEAKPAEEEAAPAPARRREPLAPGERVLVRAQAKYVRTSAHKARLVCDHIRGKSVQDARAILAHTPRAVARDWSKLLESAVANAEHNHELLGDDLRIASVTADEGPTLKRYRPRAMGRATRIRKRTSHLTILLTPKES